MSSSSFKKMAKMHLEIGASDEKKTLLAIVERKNQRTNPAIHHGVSCYFCIAGKGELTVIAMERKFMIEQIELMHTLCKNDLLQTDQLVKSTQDYINELLNIESMEETIGTEKIIFYEEILDKLQLCHNFIRNINFQFVYHKENKSCFRDNNNYNVSKTNVNGSLTLSTLDGQDLYKKFDLNNIKDKESLTICITHITNKNSLQFYGTNKNNDFLKFILLLDKLNYQKEFLSKYTYLPKEGEVFGIEIDEILYRAVIDINTLADNFLECNIILIDFGETIKVSTNITFYQLPKHIVIYPGQAFKCELKIQDQQKKEDMITFLMDHLYLSNYFRVVDIQNETVYLHTSHNVVNNQKLRNSTNPFLNTDNTESIFKSNYITTELPQHDKDEKKNVDKESKTEQKGVYLTPEEEELFFAEEVSTGNPLKAILGYNPKDDRKICKFSKKGTCFKKSNCRFLHVEQLADGWTRDEQEFDMNIKNEIVYPEIGSKIELIVTHIESPDCIYVQLHEYTDIYFDMLSDMNNNVKKLKKYSIDYRPLTHELVLCQYQDGHWYRARIVEIIEAYFMVFFLDYGNTDTVFINRIRKWDPKYETCPFMAVKCLLNGVRTKDISSENAILFLENEILNRKCLGKIINNIEDLVIDIKFENSSLSKTLIAKGLVDADINAAHGSSAVKSILVQQ